MTFAEPRQVMDVNECAFYHNMDLPGVGEVGKGWDLRNTIDDYLGYFDFRGKRVLDVGPASGYLTFEMEKRGAQVVSFDMDDSRNWQLVPFQGLNSSKLRSDLQKELDQIRNSYWLAHRLLNSRAQVYYGDIYNIPDEIGQFDVVVLGMVLPHLRDPFHALAQTSRLTRDAVIVTQQAPPDPRAIAFFIPNAQMKPDDMESYRAWWVFSEGCFREMLGILGFEIESMTRQSHMCSGRDPAGPEECLTVVGRRSSVV
jgi:SAM-dependent methyltransferase